MYGNPPRFLRHLHKGQEGALFFTHLCKAELNKRRPVAESKLVLYADDDTDDRAWVSEALRLVGAGMDIHFVENGRQVLEYLRAENSHLPALIVLDLNMPEMDGRQTLQQLKKDPALLHIPVAIVTTSNNKLDRDVCQRLGAALYLTKPDSHAEWQGVIRQLVPISS
ncbi:MAG: response regulator [Chitinophagaceae bacterium]|nr:MAG: response regulator [Chitinophagaceae bacterium]